LSTISATGLGVRHAISRAIATANLAPAEATYKVLSSRVDVDARQRVVRADVSVRIRAPFHDFDPADPSMAGWVNPDGLHPLMVVLNVREEGRALPHLVFMDVFPVTWDRWLTAMDDNLPDNIDPLCPVTGMGHPQALECARSFSKRLPTLAEFRAAWGRDRLPWGPREDVSFGRLGSPRYDQSPTVGLHPPSAGGVHDLGAWLWHWLVDGTLAGGADDMVPGFGLEAVPSRKPLGFRCAVDADEGGGPWPRSP
jgi:hypothetical protein